MSRRKKQKRRAARRKLRAHDHQQDRHNKGLSLIKKQRRLANSLHGGNYPKSEAPSRPKRATPPATDPAETVEVIDSRWAALASLSL